MRACFMAIYVLLCVAYALTAWWGLHASEINWWFGVTMFVLLVSMVATACALDWRK